VHEPLVDAATALATSISRFAQLHASPFVAGFLSTDAARPFSNRRLVFGRAASDFHVGLQRCDVVLANSSTLVVQAHFRFIVSRLRIVLIAVDHVVP